MDYESWIDEMFCQDMGFEDISHWMPLPEPPEPE